MNKRLEKAAYFFSLANSVIISIGAKKIDQKFGGTAFLAFFFIVFYRYFMKIRKYLKTFSDLQIHAHITETFAIYISAFGPSLYLISETFGCVSILSTDRCALLYECNIVVVQHLMTGAMFFGMSNFIFSRQTMTGENAHEVPMPVSRTSMQNNVAATNSTTISNVVNTLLRSLQTSPRSETATFRPFSE